MEFRSPTAAAQQNAAAITYLTKSLLEVAAGRAVVEQLIAVAQAVVRRNSHAVLEAAGDDRLPQAADQLAAVVGQTPDRPRRALGVRLQ